MGSRESIFDTRLPSRNMFLTLLLRHCSCSSSRNAMNTSKHFQRHSTWGTCDYINPFPLLLPPSFLQPSSTPSNSLPPTKTSTQAKLLHTHTKSSSLDHVLPPPQSSCTVAPSASMSVHSITLTYKDNYTQSFLCTTYIASHHSSEPYSIPDNHTIPLSLSSLDLSS